MDRDGPQIAQICTDFISLWLQIPDRLEREFVSNTANLRLRIGQCANGTRNIRGVHRFCRLTQIHCAFGCSFLMAPHRQRARVDSNTSFPKITRRPQMRTLTAIVDPFRHPSINNVQLFGLSVLSLSNLWIGFSVELRRTPRTIPSVTPVPTGREREGGPQIAQIYTDSFCLRPQLSAGASRTPRRPQTRLGSIRVLAGQGFGDNGRGLRVDFSVRICGIYGSTKSVSLNGHAHPRDLDGHPRLYSLLDKLAGIEELGLAQWRTDQL
jgi:hypothetical protein